MYQKAAPMFIVEDVDKAVTYYHEVFGAELQHRLPETAPYEWASLLIGDVEIMFWQKEAAQKEYPLIPLSSKRENSFILYIYVKDVDSLYEHVKGKETILMEPKDQPYGIREITVQDRFGIMLTFAEIAE